MPVAPDQAGSSRQELTVEDNLLNAGSSIPNLQNRDGPNTSSNVYGRKVFFLFNKILFVIIFLVLADVHFPPYNPDIPQVQGRDMTDEEWLRERDAAYGKHHQLLFVA